MPTTIKLKNSVTTTNAPTSLAQGEVAINVTDKKVWVGNAATTPVLLLGSGADGTFTNLTVSGVASFADGTVSLPSITNIGDTNTGIFFPAADTIAFTEGGVESMRIDSAGQVGVGVTPQTWSTGKAVEVGGNGCGVWGLASGTTYLTGAYYFNSTDKFGITGTYALISQLVPADGSFRWASSTATGTAGNNATMSERMRIDSSGNVGIGTSSPSGKLDVFNATATEVRSMSSTTSSYANFIVDVNNVTNQRMQMVSFGSTASDNLLGIARANNSFLAKSGGLLAVGTRDSNALVFGTNEAERMRITSSGDIGINNSSPANRLDVIGSTGADACQIKTTNSSTAINLILWNAVSSGDNVFTRFATDTTLTARGGITYNRAGGLVVYGTTSDYRAKDIIGSVLNSGEVIDSVPVYMGKMKGATQARPMFIAHETPDYAHTGEKDAVDKDGNPTYQQMDVSSLVPVLWAEVQSLRKRLALLESK